jgi:alanine dehydrogenase
MKSDQLLFLGAREIQELLTLEECIEAVERAFRLYGAGKAVPPAVLSMHTEYGGFHIKAGMLGLRREYFAAKVNGNFPGNPARFGLPTIQGLIVLCDAEKGMPLAVMDSRIPTTLRTGAATAVAAKYLARANSKIVTICGCGNQSRVQLRALHHVRRITTVFAYDTDKQQTSRLAEELGPELKVGITPVTDLAAAVQQSDICITCTPSQKPLLGPGDVKAGAFIAAVGADNPHKQEIEPGLVAKCKVVCDVLEQCAVMGDLHHALDAGAINLADVYAELGEIVAGTKPGRESEEETILFDSTGMALQDVAAAATLFERAERQGSGVRLSFAA